MIEIVFGDSACGSLKAAQSYGKGTYIGGATGIIISKKDGSKPTKQEIQAAKKAAEERQRRDWEQAVPMGGSPDDVYGFHLLLSIGDIAPQNFAQNRNKAIASLYSIYPGDGAWDFTGQLQHTLDEIANRRAQGETVRIWYSNQPDELCGLYWFCDWLAQGHDPLGEVYLVKLPDYLCLEDGQLQCSGSWGGISPGQWHRYAPLAQLAQPELCNSFAAHWRRLQEENAPLRAVYQWPAYQRTGKYIRQLY